MRLKGVCMWVSVFVPTCHQQQEPFSWVECSDVKCAISNSKPNIRCCRATFMMRDQTECLSQISNRGDDRPRASLSTCRWWSRLAVKSSPKVSRSREEHHIQTDSVYLWTAGIFSVAAYGIFFFQVLIHQVYWPWLSISASISHFKDLSAGIDTAVLSAFFLTVSQASLCL